MSRAKTVEECRTEFIEHLRALCRYWANEDRAATPLDKCEGLAFSFLVLLDGGSGFMPAYDLIPSPHPDDKAYHQENGEDWYEEGMVINDCQLHELWHKFIPRTANTEHTAAS